MIKVEIEDRESVVRLSFTSNKGSEDLDLMDRVGNAILTSAPKRGSYLGDTMVIDVKKGDA